MGGNGAIEKISWTRSTITVVKEYCREIVEQHGHPHLGLLGNISPAKPDSEFAGYAQFYITTMSET